VSVHVVTADGSPFAPSAPAAPPAPLDATGSERLDAALAGRRSQSPPLQMPWDGEPLVIAEPVLVDGEVRGAVVTVSPTTALHERELETWALIAAAVLLALALGVLVSLPVVALDPAPVRRLDEGTGRVASAGPRGGEAEPVADDSGPPELRRLSVSFDRMAETVTGALAAQRAFVADASHQLRNPLTALRLRLSNLQGHVDSAAVDDHGAALEEAERLSELLAGLLALARTERDRAPGRGGRRRRGERPGRGLAAAGRAHRAAAGARRTAGPDGVGAGRRCGDRAGRRARQRREVLLGGRPRSRCTPRGTTDESRSRSATPGPGLGPEELERATDPVLAQPSQSKREGSGLGLAIAARTSNCPADRCAWSRPTAAGCGWWRGCRRAVRTAPAADADGPSRHEVGQHPERAEQDREHEQRRQ
jgi:signal transduction histidine kinase